MMLTVQFGLDEAHDAASLVAAIALAHASQPPGDPSAAIDFGTSPVATHAGQDVHDVIRLYEQMAENESPRFVEALTDQPLTFDELAARMADKGGVEHDVASMRAIFRNVRRREKSLIANGTIGDHVVQADFSAYDQDGAGRYYLEPEAFDALQSYLGE